VAVINQVVRSMQVESGYGIKHVEMFAAWGEQFFDKGMGGTPHVFFSDIAEAWGPKWKAFIANRDAMREEMGLGDMYPAEEAVINRMGFNNDGYDAARDCKDDNCVVAQITRDIAIPTIGIGASPLCDGQILVMEDR